MQLERPALKRRSCSRSSRELRGVKKDINVGIELVTRGKAIFTFSRRKRRMKRRRRRRRNALRAAPAAECTSASRTRCLRFLVRPNGFVSRIYERSYRESQRQTFCHVRAMKTSRDSLFLSPPPCSSTFLSVSLLSPPLSFLSSWENPRGCVRTGIPIRSSRFIYANSSLVFFFCPSRPARKFDVRERKNR